MNHLDQTKLVITGMGAVTPIGVGVPAYWQALTAGQCGIGRITRFDASDLPVQIAAELKDFDPTAYMPKTLARTMDPFMQYAFVAAEEALGDSGLDIAADPDRVGIVMGTAMDGVTTVAGTQAAYDAGKRVGPRFVPMTIGNIAAAQISIAHGITGPSMTLNTACSAGGDAIMTAAMLLRTGEADAVLAVGGESILCPIVVAGLSQAHALSRRNDDPEQACRPFDADRDGFVIGEGGGALILETEEHARARGAHIYAELAGYANTSDAHHVTAPHPEGAGAAACMRRALKRAGLTSSDIGYINAHGTSTGLGDIAETQAVKAVFGGRESAPPVSSTKSMTGHLMGAGGITESIACILAIRDGILPPTLHLAHPDPACDLDYIPNEARKTRITAAMSNSLGFGGQNSSLIFTQYTR
ncbi:3-oxoacyl-[acyl-carrier-protein] synthase II [Butyricicoccus pullicaecorum DSM 23266]|uniref:3-oxoacyl-[acyl-carrier-protein] synthase 2 n=1 Tax=Butyricicoccus pullicaecorum 1.2 TaxID=1203606 RepID=R8VSN5_9FIRM|nr:beta-ketoacyl-acyl-carrier-protein synthase II [Butyricicoccus pullicaecorum 1.2]SKA64317.1 3-oxoacyl-[acyl-carrier-protein] synthase II [Butyricicoccus pullicaecorum DSM 23266]